MWLVVVFFLYYSLCSSTNFMRSIAFQKLLSLLVYNFVRFIAKSFLHRLSIYSCSKVSTHNVLSFNISRPQNHRTNVAFRIEKEWNLLSICAMLSIFCSFIWFRVERTSFILLLTQSFISTIKDSTKWPQHNEILIQVEWSMLILSKVCCCCCWQ